MLPQTILVVDDEDDMRDMLGAALKVAGYCHRDAASIHHMWQSINRMGDPDLILLDLNLPDGDGVEAAQKLVSDTNIPVIMVTGRDDAIDRITGLEVGADDYISKPFELRELMARIKSVLRRTHPHEKANGGTVRYRFDGWVYDCATWRLVHDSAGEQPLTQFEATLLRLFLDRSGQTLSRPYLAQSLGGRPHHPMDRGIDNLVSRLRKKLDRESAKRIRSVRGVGYQFVGDVSVIDGLKIQ